MLIVTIAALVMAASLGWFAYRLLREEQRRADARVAVLTAAIEDNPSGNWDRAVRAPHSEVVPQVSRRAARPSVPSPAPAPRPAPPVATGATAPAVPEIVFLEDDGTAGRDFMSERDDWMAGASAPAARGASIARAAVDTNSRAFDDIGVQPALAQPAGGLFGETRDRQRLGGFAVLMLGALAAVLLAVGYTWFSSNAPEPAAAAAVDHSARAVAPATGGVPLELVSLAHEQRQGSLIVRGVVRNPVAGSDRRDVVASVMLLDAAGGVLGSGRAPLRERQLRPGQDSPFTVELPSHADVRRYRVTFRAPDGTRVAHADRRTRTPSSSS